MLLIGCFAHVPLKHDSWIKQCFFFCFGVTQTINRDCAKPFCFLFRVFWLSFARALKGDMPLWCHDVLIVFRAEFVMWWYLDRNLCSVRRYGLISDPVNLAIRQVDPTYAKNLLTRNNYWTWLTISKAIIKYQNYPKKITEDRRKTAQYFNHRVKWSELTWDIFMTFINHSRPKRH